MSGRRVLIEREWGDAADPGMKGRIHFAEGPYPVAEVSGMTERARRSAGSVCRQKNVLTGRQPDDEAGIGPVAVRLVDQCVDQARTAVKRRWLRAEILSGNMMSQPSVLGWTGVVTGPVNDPPRGRTRQADIRRILLERFPHRGQCAASDELPTVFRDRRVFPWCAQ